MFLTEAMLLAYGRKCNAGRRAGGIEALCLALAIAAAAVVGCDTAPPPVTDLSKTPWLDPKVQAKGLSDGDKRIRGLSAFNLGNIGAPAADAIPALQKLAQDDPDAKVRELSKQALERIRANVGSAERGD